MWQMSSDFSATSRFSAYQQRNSMLSLFHQPIFPSLLMCISFGNKITITAVTTTAATSAAAAV